MSQGLWRTAALGLIPLGLFLLALASLPPAPEVPQLLLLLAAGLLTEISAVKKLDSQSVGPAQAVYLAAALTPTLGWAPAAVALGLCTAVREALAGRKSGQKCLLAGVASALPGLVSLALLGQTGNLVLAGVAYLLLPFLVAAPLGLDSTTLQRAARRKLLPLGLATVALGWLARDAAGAGALVLLGLAYAYHKVVEEADSADRYLLSLKLNKADTQVEDLGQKLSKAHTALAETGGDKDLLQQTSAAFPGTLKMEETCARVLILAKGLLPARSVVLFLERDGELEIARAAAPDLAGRPFPRASAQVGEPAVDRCWREARAVMLMPQTERKRLLPGDQACAALPLAGLGVLYLGGPRELFSKKELPRLKLLARQAALALAVAQHNENRDLAMLGISKAQKDLERWVQRLDRLLVAGQRLAQEKNSEAVLAHLCRILEDLAPHDRLVCLSPKGETMIGKPLENQQPLRAVAAEMLRFSGPALADGSETPAEPLAAPGMLSMLAAPLLVDEKPLALIFLFASEEAVFTREHRHLLLVLLAQAGTIISNLRLQEQLAQGHKMAAIGQMAAGLAHELNNPFGAIQLSLDMLAGRASDDKSVARIDSANRALERARNVVAKLQYYTKFQPERESRLLDLHEIIERVLGEVSYMLDGVEVQLLLEATPSTLDGNSEELEQVVSNLLTNACDAMLETGQETRRLVLATSREGARLRLLVSDNGPGMSKEVAARATEPFFTTKPPGKGTGLGLSLCERIVDQHGGSLSVGRSAEGGAAVFVDLTGSTAFTSR